MAFIAQSESGASTWPLCYIAADFLQMRWKQKKKDEDMDLYGFITMSEQSTSPDLERWGETEVSFTPIEMDRKVLRA